MKEVAFMFFFLFFFLASPFCDVQWLAGCSFCEAVIIYSFRFQKLHPLFMVLPNLHVGKLKLCLILLMLE